MSSNTFNLLYENLDFIVVSKSCEVTFEGVEGILAILRREFREVYGIHRLDKATSGLMIFAKNKEVQRQISELFASRKVEKTYLALSKHRPKKKMGTIKGDLVKGRGGSFELKRSLKRPSITKFESIFLEKTKLRLFKLYPLTGQTHQLRVHLKSIGSPILGDTRYSKDPADRMYLACVRLKFNYQNKNYDFHHFPETGDFFRSDEILRQIG